MILNLLFKINKELLLIINNFKVIPNSAMLHYFLNNKYGTQLINNLHKK